MYFYYFIIKCFYLFALFIIYFYSTDERKLSNYTVRNYRSLFVQISLSENLRIYLSRKNFLRICSMFLKLSLLLTSGYEISLLGTHALLIQRFKSILSSQLRRQSISVANTQTRTKSRWCITESNALSPAERRQSQPWSLLVPISAAMPWPDYGALLTVRPLGWRGQYEKQRAAPYQSVSSVSTHSKLLKPADDQVSVFPSQTNLALIF